MKHVNRLTLLIVIGAVITMALPILAAITLARAQGSESERQYALGLAHRALVRSEMTGDQLGAAARAINALTPEEACSPEGLDIMRRIDLGSTLLQAVGWVEGDTMRCSSVQGPEPFNLGRPDFVSSTGSVFRRQVILFDPNLPYVAVQTGHSVGIVHKDLALSFVDNVPGLGASVFSWSQRVPLLSRGNLNYDLLKRDFAGDSVFLSGDRLVAVVKSRKYDTGAIVVLPQGHGSEYASRMIMVLIPIGLMVGVVLSAVLIHVIRNRASLPMMIRTALKRGKFHLLYQPVVDLQTGGTVGVEALIRWDRGNSPEIPPDRFIPAAEEAGLIPLITARVLELLAEDAWDILRVAPDFHFAVNFSAQDMHGTNILAEVNRMIERSGIQFQNLVVEATERSLVDVELAKETIERLRVAGVKVAIDDFGTGYSSLAYLAQLEVDFLKIDKLFVQALGTDSATNQVAGRIIEMAKDLNLKIIAEGVETTDQQALLKHLNVEFAQGYLFGKPMPLEDLLVLLRAQRRAVSANERKHVAQKTASNADPNRARLAGTSFSLSSPKRPRRKLL
jgi:sensor c-di-GMP phosphodiesterase-like protein